MAIDAHADVSQKSGAAASSGRPTAHLRDVGGLELLTVDAGDLVAVFLPQVGARLLSLTWHGEEFLWRNPSYFDGTLQLRVPRESWPAMTKDMASWVNLGGAKTWPAPQGWSGPHEWAGPPDEVLDGGPWSHESHGDGDSLIVMFSSQEDPRTRLRVTREFTFERDSPRFSERVVFRSESAVRWSIWEVVQVETANADLDTPAGVYVDVDGAQRPRNLLEAMPPLLHERLAKGVVRIPLQSAVGKIGFANATGRVRYVAPSGAELELSTVVTPGAQYPDGGSRVEVWMQAPTRHPIRPLGDLHPDAFVAELELLSPLLEIGPESPAELEISWHLRASSETRSIRRKKK